jgi:hypothetical protein
MTEVKDVIEPLFNAIHDQAITLYEELSRLAADVAEERLR